LQFWAEYAILEGVSVVRKKNGTKTKHMYAGPVPVYRDGALRFIPLNKDFICQIENRGVYKKRKGLTINMVLLCRGGRTHSHHYICFGASPALRDFAGLKNAF